MDIAHGQHYRRDDKSVMKELLPGGGLSSRTRRDSMDQPPTFRIVLVGHDWLRKNKVGNTLLGKDVFEKQNPSSPTKNHNSVFSGYVLDRVITVTNTAELFASDLSDNALKEKVKECVSLCAPGPHALVLVINPEDFDKEKRKRMEGIINSFSDQAFQHSIVFTYKDHKMDKKEYKSITELCRGTYQYKKQDQAGALKAIEDMISKKEWSVLACDLYDDAVDAAHMNTMEMKWSGNGGPVSTQRLNLVLCGSSAAAKASAADLILGEQTEPSPQPSSVCVKREAEVCGRHVTLVLLPALSETQLSEEEAMVQMLNCLQLCHPGIHAFLLVLPQGGQNDEDKKEWDLMLNIEAQEFILPLNSSGFEQQAEGMATSRGAAQPTTQTGTTEVYLTGSSLKAEALLDVVEKITAKNGFYTTKMFFIAQEKKYNGQLTEMKNNMLKLHIHINTLKPSRQGPVSTGRLNLVLCGSSAAAKASAAALILGEQTEPSSAWVKREADVHRHHITLFLLPSLGKIEQSEEALLQETQKCLYLCDPGVHAFIFVIAQNQWTDEDKVEWEKIKHLFGEEVGTCCKTVLTRESEAADGLVIAHNVQDSFQGSYLLDNASKVVSLLEEVENMGRTACYTSDMAIAAQLNSHLKCHSELEDMMMKLEKLQSEMGTNQGLQEDSESLRIVLLGKTGEGKSATGNTILGKNVFKEHFSFKSVTNVCQKETVIVNRRLVTVVDTPGLFDTEIDNEEIKKEIIKCIGMAAPGPHAFVFVKALGRFTQEQRGTVKMIQTMFGDESGMHMLVLFTGGDKLQGESLDEHLQEAGSDVLSLLRRCGNRYHVFDNTDKSNTDQVCDLLSKIDSIVKVNKGKCYTSETFERVEEALKQEQERILREREEEIKREKEELESKHKVEMEKLKKGMEEERRRQEEERMRREEEFKSKEEDMKAAMLKLEQDERAKGLAMNEEYERRKKENEDWIKQRISEVQMERQKQQEEWEMKKKAEQKKREEEEEKRKNKEMELEKEWQERQRREQEEFKSEMEQILKESKEEEKKRKQEYEERVRKEEEKQKELEEKIKHAEQSKIKELEEQKRKHEEDCQNNRLEEEKRKNEWKNKLDSMTANWQEQQRQEQERYEREKQEEKQKREDEEARRKLEEEIERRKIEQDAERKIEEKEDEMKKLQQEYDKKLQDEEKKLAKQQADMEAQLRVQREKFEEQKDKEAKANEEKEKRNIEYLKEWHEKEKDLLKRETEMAARKQAEDEFNKELDNKVKEAKAEGHNEGYREGHNEGHKEGQDMGLAEGHEIGRNVGMKEGQLMGLIEGWNVGKTQGKLEVESERCALGKGIDASVNNIWNLFRKKK